MLTTDDVIKQAGAFKYGKLRLVRSGYVISGEGCTRPSAPKQFIGPSEPKPISRNSELGGLVKTTQII